MAVGRLLSVLALGLLLTACGGSDTDESGRVATPLGKLKLKSFSPAQSCAEFVDYAAAALTERYLHSFCLFNGCFENSPDPDPSANPGSGNSDGATPDRVSEQQNQEAGVDEADIVKVDKDGYLYLLDGGWLRILDAFPPGGLANAALGELDLAAGDNYFYASDMFLDETARRVIVLASHYGQAKSRVVSLVIDVSDRAHPVVSQRLEHDGYPLTSRRIGTRVHRVASFGIPTPAWLNDDAELTAKRQQYFQAQQDGKQADQDRIKAETLTLVRSRALAAGAASLLPQLSDSSGTRTLGCASVARPEVNADLGMVIIDSFDTDGSDRATSAAINNSWMVYASTNNLYLAQSSFGWRFDDEQADETAIYRFKLDAQGPAVYQGLGKIPGSVGDRFQFSEFGGYLRVASTERRWDDQGRFDPLNHLHVLRADRALADMETVGSVKNFAPGETIQGARFVGKRGYVVTFRQVDPLFGFDLGKPDAPAIVSELKIPGFSSYLSPLGEDYLLTVGREGDDTALTGRMQVSLFDVRDLKNVSQIATLVPAGQPGNYSYSSAEYDPHAFTYFPDSAATAAPGKLALPLQVYGGGFSNNDFSGTLLLAVNPAAGAAGERLREIGRVDHRALAVPQVCIGTDFCYDAIWAADPRRAVFMQDAQGSYLYTVSAAGVIASDVADPAQELGRRQLPLPTLQYGCCIGFIAD